MLPGDKRFAEPEPAEEWAGRINATSFGSRCLQSGKPKADESEDCLYLNIYSPSLNGSTAVMVWFHGGSFDTGSANDARYEGSTLAEKGVVVVAINSRLGSFGFLSTGDDVMPGNYGLLDQVLALKWIQSNIHAFGGDPSQVTIFGGSSGAASVSFHILSPLSKGLFHRAIMQSGFSLSIWACERPGTLIKVSDFAKKLGTKLGCATSDSALLLSCLRKVEAVELQKETVALRNELHLRVVTTPRVETKFGFLPDFPEKILDRGTFNRVDTLRGYNSGDESLAISDPDEDGISVQEFSQFYRAVSEIYPLANETNEYILSKVIESYLGNETNPLAIRSQLINALTDTSFALSGVLELQKTLNQDGGSHRHYLYELDYQIKTIISLNTLTPSWMGVVHGADLDLVFAVDNVGLATVFISPDDRAVANKVQLLWTNFAKFGNPVANEVLEDGNNVQWESYTNTSPDLLKINLKSSLEHFPRPRSVDLYNSFLQKVRNDTAS